MNAARPSGTVTFLFTDIESSTQWWEQYPAWMAHAFPRHEAVLRAAAEAHGGYIYKMIGDGFQIAFDTAVHGLNAAIEAQRSLHTEDWGEPGPLRVRMALHTGVTDERGDDYVGPVLNRLGRLLTASQGGQILLSQATYELVRDAVSEQTELRDLGIHRLRDLTRPEHIYQATVPGLPADFPPIRTLDLFPHNLPLQLTSFIGREKEIVQVKRLLLGDRFVTLTGPGGTGKTRLGLQIGAELLELFPDGVWLVELASLSDPTLLPQTVAGALGMREPSGRPILSLLTGYLREKELLLILDNCEHLLAASAQLTNSLLQACPYLCVLATSREALNIPGETTFRVPSLSTPDLKHLPALQELTKFESMRLFLERAESIKPGLVLTDVNAHAIAQICQRLDGIPLAIELAVARVKVMPVEQVAERLNDRFRLLTGGSRSALPRHQTLRALIDWSYDLLSESERALFARLSVFAGGWTLEGAEAICVGEVLGRGEILDLLTQLVNKSLVITEGELNSEARFRLLETIRQYASERLVEAGSGDRVRERHLEHFLQFTERLEPRLRGPEQVTQLDRLEKEVDNLRAALEWSLESNVEAGLRMASALFWFWHIRSRRAEGSEWLERLLAAGTRLHPDEPIPENRMRSRGQALNVLSSLMVMHGSPARGEELAEESLSLHQKLGEAGKRGTAHALWNLAQAVAHLEDFERARELAEKSLNIFRELDDKFWIAQCLDNLGNYELNRSNFESARAMWEEDLELRREIGDKDGIAWIIFCLGNLSFWEGNHDKTEGLYTESRSAFHAIGNKWGVSLALSGLGSVVLARGDFERATELYAEALAFGRDMGDQNTIAGRRYDLARVAWSRGEYAEAGRLYSETLATVRRLNHKSGIASTLYELGEVAWAQGDHELAARYYEEALGIGREIDGQFSISYALNGLGQLALSQRDFERARALHQEALRTLQGTGHHWGIAYCLEAFLYLAAGERDMYRAAVLAGATETLYRQFRFLILSPIERDAHERNLAEARAALGEEAFARASATGRAMTMDQAVEFALSQEDRT